MTTSVDAGDATREGAIQVPMTSSGSGSAGDLVKDNGSGKVTPTTANGNSFVGVLAEDSGSDGDTVGVVVFGPVAVVPNGSINQGDLLQADGTNNGEVVSADSNEGLATAVDEGASDTYDIYSKYLMALEGASASDGTMEAFLG